MVNFSEKFGLPKDRVKLETGLADFDIVKIEIIQSKKKYDQRVEGIDGNTTIIKRPINIAYIDLIFEGDKETKKVYSPNAAIVASCLDMLKAYGKADGTLKEPVRIEEVKEGIGESKNPYLFFT
jgi:hypothetical protein